MKNFQTNNIKNAKLNAIAGYSSYIANVIIGFIISPLLLKYLGSNDFGVLKTIQKYLGFASVADGRATQSLKWVIANNLGKGKIAENKEAIGSAIVVWKYFLPFVILIITLIIIYIPHLIFNLQESEYKTVRILSALLGFNMVFASLLGIPDSVLVGSNQGFRSVKVNIIWMVFTNIGLVLVTIYGFGLIGIGFITVVFALFKGLNILILAKMKIPWFGVKKPLKKAFKKFLHFSSWTLLWVFVSKFLLSSEIILLSYIIGSTTVSNYVFSSYFVQIGITITALLTSSLTPTLGKLIGKNNITEASQIIDFLRQTIFAISIFISSQILIFNENFLSFWVGDDYFVGRVPNFIIVILMVEIVLIRNEAFIINVGLQIKKKVLIGLFSVLISLFLGYCFSYIFADRLIGILIGLFIGRFLMLIIFPKLVIKHLKIETKYFNNIFQKTVVSIILLSISFIIGIEIKITSIWAFVILVFISIIIYGLFIYKLLLSSNVQKKILTHITKF